MRQIVLDTETTGLEPTRGHRIIEIGCVEMVHRRLTGNHYHVYINPRREVDDGAIEVHGITNEFLADKPFFEDIAEANSYKLIHIEPYTRLYPRKLNSNKLLRNRRMRPILKMLIGPGRRCWGWKIITVTTTST